MATVSASKRLLCVIVLGLLLVQLPLSMLPADSGTGATGARDASDMFSRVSLPYSPTFSDADWTADGSLMYVAATSGHTLKYNSTTRVFTNVTTENSYSSRNFNAISVAPNGTALAVGNDGLTILIPPTGSWVDFDPGLGTTDLTDVDFCPDGSYAYMTSGIPLWKYYSDNRTVVQIDSTIIPDWNTSLMGTISIRRIAFRPGTDEAMLVATTGYDRYVFKINATNITDISSKFGAQFGVVDMAWSPDGLHAIVVGTGSSIKLWHADTETVENLSPGVSCIGYNVAWRNNTAAYLVLDVGSNLLKVFTYTGSTDLAELQGFPVYFPISDISWSPDGSEGFLLSENGYLYRSPNMPPAQVYISAPMSYFEVNGGVATGSVYLNWQDKSEPDFGRYEVHVNDVSEYFTPSPASNYTNYTRNSGEGGYGGLMNYSVKGLLTNHTYYFKIRTVDIYGAYSDSNVATMMTPVAPAAENLTVWVSSYGQGYIQINWTKSQSPYFSYYYVYVHGSDNFTGADPVYSSYNKNVVAYNYTNVAPNTKYYVAVQHLIQWSLFSWSNTVNVTTPDVGVPAMGVSDVTEKSAYFTWTWSMTGTYTFNSYQFFYSTSSANLFDAIYTSWGSVNNKYFSLSGLKSMTHYYAAVRANYTVGGIPQNRTSNIVEFTTTDAPPIANVSVSHSNVLASTADISFSWSPGSTGESLWYYLLFVSTDQNSVWSATPINVSSSQSSPYRLTGLANGTTYYYAGRIVTTTNRMSNSSSIKTFTTTVPLPASPVRLYITVPTSTSSTFQLSWNKTSSSNLQRYEIYYSAQSGFTPDPNENKLNDLVNTNSYLTFNLNSYTYQMQEGRTYYFKVRVVCTDGGTADSNEVSGKYDIKPTAVTSVRATVKGYDKVYVSWNKPSYLSDFKQYVVEYKKSDESTWHTAEKVTNFNTTSCTVSGLDQDTRYYFKVRIQDDGGNYSPDATSSYVTTEENLVAMLFLGSEAGICLPLLCLIFAAGIVGGIAKKSPKAAAIGSPIVVGFLILFILNILSTAGMNITQESKWQMFMTIILITVLISVAWGMYALATTGWGRYTYPVILATPIVCSLFAEAFLFIDFPKLAYVPLMGFPAATFTFVFGIIATIVIIAITAARAGQRVAANKLAQSRMRKEELQRKQERIARMIPELQGRIAALNMLAMPFINTSEAATFHTEAMKERKEENVDGAIHNIDKCEEIVSGYEQKVSEYRQKEGLINENIPGLERRLESLEKAGYTGVSTIQVREAIAETRRQQAAKNMMGAAAGLEKLEKDTVALEVKLADFQKKAGEIKAKIPGLVERIERVEAMPKHPNSKIARKAVEDTRLALDTRDIETASQGIERAEKNVMELEANAKDKDTQRNELEGRLRNIGGTFEDFARWNKRSAAVDLRFDQAKVDKTMFKRGQDFEAEGLGMISAKMETARKALDNDDLPTARDAALAAERGMEMFKKFRTDWQSGAGRIQHLASQVEAASKWAALDKQHFSTLIDDIKGALVVNDMATANGKLAQLQNEVSGFESVYIPELSVSFPPDAEYQKDMYEDFKFTVRNDGKAMAQDITVFLDAPADFGTDDKAEIRIPRLAPGEAVENKVSMSFNKEGKVPYKMTMVYHDSHRRKMPEFAERYIATVVKEKLPKKAVKEEGQIVVNGRPLLEGGFMKAKVAIVNHSGKGMANAKLLMTYKREVLSFHHIYPDSLLQRFKYYPGEGQQEDVLGLGYLDPKDDREVAMDLYFHPYICTETAIRLELRYTDVEGESQHVTAKPINFQCYCPTFGSCEVPNPAMVTSFMENPDIKRQERNTPIPDGVSPKMGYEMMKYAASGLRLNQVGKDNILSKDPFTAWTLFFGEEVLESGQRVRYAIKATVIEAKDIDPTAGVKIAGVIQFKICGEMMTKLTALLSTLIQRFNAEVEKQLKIKQPINIYNTTNIQNITDSIIYKSNLGLGGPAGEPGGAAATNVTEIKGSVVAKTAISGAAKVEDSILTKTQVGGATAPQLPTGSDERTNKAIRKYYDQYHRSKFNDGVIDEEERSLLDTLIEFANLDEKFVKQIEAMVEKEYENQMVITGGTACVPDEPKKPSKPTAPSAPAKPKAGGKSKCPHCGEAVNPGDVVCGNCGDMIN